MMLTDEERLNGASKLREDLRNERRNGTSGPNEGSNQHAASIRSSDGKGRSEGETTGTDADTTIGEHKTTRGSNRGTKGSNLRGRQDYGRFINDRLGSSEGSDQTTKPIGLESIDAPITHKNTTKLEIPKIFATKKKQPLSSGEIEALQDTLPACLQSYGGYIDQIIHNRSKVENAQDIWGDLTIDEARMIARILIKRGTKSGHAADFVRQIVSGEDYMGAVVVLVPRAIKSVEELRLTPNAKRIRK